MTINFSALSQINIPFLCLSRPSEKPLALQPRTGDGG